MLVFFVRSSFLLARPGPIGKQGPGDFLSYLVMLVCATFLATACGASSHAASRAMAPEQAMSADDAVATEAAGPMPPSARPAAAPGWTAGNAFGAPAQTPSDDAATVTVPEEEKSPAAPPRQPLLIYDATITLAVFEAAEGLDAVEKLASQSGGYLVQRSDRQIKIRVPSAKFTDSLETIQGLGDELHRQVHVRDVTEEFSDLTARLQNARAVRARLEELLGRAQTTEEALKVERELQRVTLEIEQTLGRLKVLGELVAFSTITVVFEPRPIDQVESEVHLPFPWLYELGLPNLLAL